MGLYLRPGSLDVALDALRTRPLTVLAGGTDYYPTRVGQPLQDDVLDVTAISELNGIHDAGSHWRIGATTTWTRILEAALPPMFDGLKAAAREVGGAQIQNAGTIAGNLCNASPAADGVPPLLALDAAVELRSTGRVRRMPLGEFIVGSRQTRRAPAELVTAILVPKPGHPALGGFLKLGARRYLVISILMASAVLELDAAGRIAAARVAVGACSPVARRLPSLERALVGRAADVSLGDCVAPGHLEALSPIDDVRASRAYRLEAAATVVRRLLADLGARA
jgi:CO/xanthine dehydrogenase FAD-binding subunit